jgi:hypothetical protein
MQSAKKVSILFWILVIGAVTHPLFQFLNATTKMHARVEIYLNVPVDIRVIYVILVVKRMEYGSAEKATTNVLNVLATLLIPGD